MKTALLFCFCLLSWSSLSAQSSNKVWTFGWGCGVDFNTNPPIAIATSANAYEGCASVSNTAGQLLFYNTGDTIYNRNHQVMPNGSNVAGAPMIASCSQGSLIVPRPGSSTQYYLFTLQGITDGLPQGKLFYNLVDMTLDGGLGDVMPGRKLVQIDAGLTEKMTAVAGTCDNIWVIVCPQSGDQFRAYEVTAGGVNTTPVISPIVPAAPGMYDIGVMKASHQGDRLVSANYNGGVFQLLDFDNAQGTVSNPVDISNGPVFNPYSACFSPDDSRLYLLFDSIYQYNLSLPTTVTMLASKTGIAPITSTSGKICGDMQTAPDGRIYIAKLNDVSLDGIPFPNAPGTGCGYIPAAIPLTATALSGVGLPNAVVNGAKTGAPLVRVQDTLICAPWLATATATTGPYQWSTGDTTRDLPIAQPGTYWVAGLYGCGTTDTFHVGIPGERVALHDTTLCIGEPVKLAISLGVPPAATVLWSTGDTGPAINLTDTGAYTVQVTEGGCVEHDTMAVRYVACGCDFLLPSAFSPNKDGLNDFFAPTYRSANCTGLETFRLKIFNRFGQEVYSGTQADAGWNGTYSGQPADVGVYLYYFTYTDGKAKEHSGKGDLTLLR